MPFMFKKIPFFDFSRSSTLRSIKRGWKRTMEHPGSAALKLSLIGVPGALTALSVPFPAVRALNKELLSMISEPVFSTASEGTKRMVVGPIYQVDKGIKRINKTLGTGIRQLKEPIQDVGAAIGDSAAASTRRTTEALREMMTTIQSGTERTANKVSSIFGEGLDNAFKKYALPGLASIGVAGATGYLTDYLTSGMPKGRRNLLTAMSSGASGALTYIGIKMAQKKGLI